MVADDDTRAGEAAGGLPVSGPGSAQCRDLGAVVMRGVWDFDGYVRSINPGHQIVLGWSFKELSSVPSWEFVHPDEQDWLKRCQQMLRTRSDALFGVDLRILSRDGTYLWTRWNARSMPGRRRIRLDGVVISDRAPGQTSPPALVGCWEWHLGTDTATWSQEMFELFGLPARTSVTRDAWLSRTHPADRRPIQRAIQRTLVRHQPFSADHRVQRRCGRCRILHSAGRVITDEHGDPRGIRGITQDRTQHVEAASR